MEFTGIPEEAFEFFEGLAADNSKTYWTAHRETFESAVRRPLEALFAELEGEFGPGKMFRPYRDLRFSKDKSPYKTHLGGHADGLYVGLDADGLTVAGGFEAHAPDQLERYRAAVDADGPGEELRIIVEKLRSEAYDIRGDRLKTRPRGAPPDHPRLDLLRHRSLIAGLHWPPEPWMDTSEVAARVRDAWRPVQPLVDWGARHVGPAAV